PSDLDDGLTRMCIDSGRPKKGRGLVKWRSNALHCFAAFCITCNPIRERPALEMKLEGGWDDNLFFLRPARRGHDMTNHAPEEADGRGEREREREGRRESQRGVQNGPQEAQRSPRGLKGTQEIQRRSKRGSKGVQRASDLLVRLEDWPEPAENVSGPEGRASRRRLEDRRVLVGRVERIHELVLLHQNVV